MTKNKAERTKKLSTEPYKGTRDFYPEEQFVQNYIFSTWRKVVESYGYVEYNASLLEETDLYRAKTGSEIVDEQTYTFTDRGGREVTIRPEMTPTVARMVARKRNELSFPLRWYSIPNLFRYERPQRGRLREHWQLNADIFGLTGTFADAEVIAMARDIMKGFGAEDSHFRIRLNNRKLMNSFLREYLGLDEKTSYLVSKLIDRRAKMEKKEFDAQVREFLKDRAADFLAVLDARSLSEIPSALQESNGAKELRELTEQLTERDISNFEFDPTLMRGFDYYTGTVFEIFDTNPANSRSLFGGGRYDDLVGIFDVEKVSGVGFGMGDVTIRDFLETHGLVPKYVSPTKLYLCLLSTTVAAFAEELALFLREKGIPVAIDYTGRKVPAQLKTAEKQSIPFIVCIGDEEVKTRTFKLKNLETREEKEVVWNDLPNELTQ